MNTKSYVLQNTLYIELSDTSIKMSQCLWRIFFYLVNNYEINLILKSYLLMWEGRKDLGYVPLTVLCFHLPAQCSGLLYKFFPTRIII